jgi:hypothetical protein
MAEMKRVLADGGDVPTRIFRESEVHSERADEHARAFAARIEASAGVSSTAVPN